MWWGLTSISSAAAAVCEPSLRAVLEVADPAGACGGLGVV